VVGGLTTSNSIRPVSVGGCRLLELLLADVGHEEDDSEDDAEGANYDVADGQEVVLSSEHVGGR